jgi:hypothetical protein
MPKPQVGESDMRTNTAPRRAPLPSVPTLDERFSAWQVWGLDVLVRLVAEQAHEGTVMSSALACAARLLRAGHMESGREQVPMSEAPFSLAHGGRSGTGAYEAPFSLAHGGRSGTGAYEAPSSLHADVLARHRGWRARRPAGVAGRCHGRHRRASRRSSGSVRPGVRDCVCDLRGGDQ